MFRQPATASEHFAINETLSLAPTSGGRFGSVASAVTVRMGPAPNWMSRIAAGWTVGSGGGIVTCLGVHPAAQMASATAVRNVRDEIMRRILGACAVRARAGETETLA